MDNAVGFEGKELPFGDGLAGIAFLVVQVVRRQIVRARCFARNQEFIALLEAVQGFEIELRHTDLFEEIGALACKGFLACGT